MDDLVSIIMPSFNTANYILKSIESVKEQTYANWELIIVDDCSTDNTREVLDNIDDDRIRIFYNEVNMGAAVSRNRALQEAKGKWIAFLDSDDLWTSDKLEKQISFMENNDYHFSYTNYLEINSDDEKNGRMITGPKKITKRKMFNYCWVGCLTVMYDREYVGLIQIENIKKNNDYAMWLKVSKKANCYLLNESLAFYRRGRSGSISSQNYLNLIKWHYRLFRLCEKKSVIISFFNTIRNLFYGIVKKILYVKHI